MNLREAIMNRRSIRGFKNQPISKEILADVLKMGTRAVSRTNIQPWEFAVVTGETLDRIRKANVECFKNLQGGGKDSISEIYRRRRIDIAKLLFSKMDIQRGNNERRMWWAERGYRYFDAPAAIIIYTGETTAERDTFLDIGCVAQNICVAAMEHGLGTCVEIQGTAFPQVLYRELGVPEDKQFVVAIAIGYPDNDFPANEVISPREDVDTLTRWYGF